MSDLDVPEECPHCDDAPPSLQLDAHVARVHADLPPCTARIEPEAGGRYACGFRAGHAGGLYGTWHASKRGADMGRYIWNDTATGATPHRPPEQSDANVLAKFKRMGAVSHTVVATSEVPDSQDTGRRCPRCDCPDGHTQCRHCKVCPHARRPGDAVTAQQPVRPPTPDEHFRELYRRTAELGDRVAALINPAWGIKTGVLPEDHPFHPSVGEQGAPVDWQAIARQCERELKKVGEARHRAEQAIARVRAVIAERRIEVAEREEGGMLPYGTPGASWCDAITVTCARVEDALRTPAKPGFIPANPDQQNKENSA